jgi:hypothetical protein
VIAASEIYSWEMETIDGVVLKQYNEKGEEQSWKILDPDKVVRVTLVPVLPVMPTHSCVLDLSRGERFIRRFGRGFLKLSQGFQLKYYINCIVTTNYRMYVISDGRVIITRNDYELYL